MNYVLMALGILLCLPAIGRQAPEQYVPTMPSMPDKAFQKLDCESESASMRLQKQTRRYARRLQKLEAAMYKTVRQKDSSLAKQLFADAQADYARLLQPSATTDVFRSVYSSGLDSITTALRFTQSQLPQGDARITQSLQGLQQVQQQLNVSEQLTQYLQQRQQLLQQQLQQVGMVNQLQQFNKQCYYYKAQVMECRQMLNNPQLLENKLLSTVRVLPAFQNFFHQHSQLASLFALPSNTATGGAAIPEGLQTREMVTSSLQSRYGNMQVVNETMRQNMPSPQSRLQQAQSQLASNAEGSAGNSSRDMPAFQPNNQKTKTFWQRVTLGMNVQSQKASYYFPVITDLAVTAGYRLSDKLLAGVGVSGKIGWGTGWSHIQLSAQGLGLRSFVEAKLKGSFWMVGGYELNYRPSLDSLSNLHTGVISCWQKSGLAGVSKIISLRSKTFQHTKVQLLWDFLSYQQRPRTPALLWRIEYSFH